MHKVILSAMLGVALSGCSGVATSPAGASRMAFANATVDGQPVRWVLDSGASNTFLLDSSAARLGLTQRTVPDVTTNVSGTIALTGPAKVTVGSQDFTLPLMTGPAPNGTRADFDGSIGWPEVRDNILVFDGAARSVTVADTLPAPVAGWTKLKVLRRNQLFLEWPLADGRMLTVFVDTGSPSGVSLPPEMWKAFKETGPMKSWRQQSYFIGAEMEEGEVVWGSEVELGSVKLFGVPVREYSHRESSMRPGDAELGIYALAVLDLVVDAKNGWAYLRPHPPGSTNAPAKQRNAVDQSLRGNWTVDPGLRLALDSLRASVAYSEGSILAKNGNAEGAIAQFAKAAELKPGDAEAYAYLAWAKLRNEDFEGAAMEIKRAMELKPDMAFLYFLQSLLWARLGDFSVASAAYERSHELDPDLVRIEGFKELGEKLEQARAARK